MKIIVDTREKHPWTFDGLEGIETISQKLDTGDYAIEGREDLLCIERKESVSEIAGNIVKPRFWNEMERMQDYRWKFLLLEFGPSHVDGFPNNLKVSKKVLKRIQIKGPFIRKELARIQVQYGIHVMYCEHRIYAEQAAISIIKRVLEELP